MYSKFLTRGMAMVCAVSLYACSESEDIPQNSPVVAGGGIELVGDNEYIITVGNAVTEATSTRGIDQQGYFDATYEANKIYVHSMTDDKKNVVVFNVNGDGNTKSFSYRVKYDDNGYTVSGDASEPIGTTENEATYSNDEKVYLSSWADDIWSNTVNEQEAAVGKYGTIPYMNVQMRSDEMGTAEMYRSDGEFDRDALLNMPNTGITMKRIVAAYMNTVLFTDLTVRNKIVDEDEWNRIITDKRGAVENWKIVCYLGEFPTSYNLKNETAGEGKAYYSSGTPNDENDGFLPFNYLNHISIPGGNPLIYYGFGLKTAVEYLMTPVETNNNENIVAYIVIQNNVLNKKSVHKIESFGEGESACHPIQNQIDELITIYDLRDLAAGFGLEYVNANGEKVAAKSIESTYNVPISVASSSRSGSSDFIDFDLKPRKVIHVTE